MRKRLTTLALAAFAATAMLPMTASPAQAWTCQIKDLPMDPDPGDIACEVFLKATGPLCYKYGCN
jgi:hypothetical protein